MTAVSSLSNTESSTGAVVFSILTAELSTTRAESSTTDVELSTTGAESSASDAESSVIGAGSSTTDAGLSTTESTTTGAESSTALGDKPRCTHYIPCHCPSLPEHASLPLGDESSPLWLQRPHEDEDYNKVIVERIKRQYWRRIATALYDTCLAFKLGRPLIPPKVRSFRWLISSDLVPRGYEDGQAPWRMLVRFYMMDLPEQLAEEYSERSIFAWRKNPRRVGELCHRTKLDDAPPEITCGRRAVFSQHSRNFNSSLVGDWLAIVYFWATDGTWAEKTDFIDLVSIDSVAGIRAWEFVDAVDAPVKIPHLFYQCRVRDNWELDAVYAGHPYQRFNSVQIKFGDPVPARLDGLRHLMNGRARHLYYATHEYEYE
ncbi:hypothetical protein V8C35DRAFT_330641 [Trichoderma chlorosporum]